MENNNGQSNTLNNTPNAPDAGGQVAGGNPAAEQRIQEIMTQLTPELKRTDPKKYNAFLDEKHTLYERRYPEPSETTAETGKQAESRAKELMATPGYADGSLKNTNPYAWQKLQDEITRLFNVASAAESQQVFGVNNEAQKKAEAQSSLIMDAVSEWKRLGELGFERGKMPSQIEPYHVEAWKQQRLLAEGNYAELTPLVAQDLNKMESSPKAGTLFSAFMSENDFDPDLKNAISELVIKHIFESKRSRK
jgi:hypothetical protein